MITVKTSNSLTMIILAKLNLKKEVTLLTIKCEKYLEFQPNTHSSMDVMIILMFLISIHHFNEIKLICL